MFELKYYLNDKFQLDSYVSPGPIPNDFVRAITKDDVTEWIPPDVDKLREESDNYWLARYADAGVSFPLNV